MVELGKFWRLIELDVPPEARQFMRFISKRCGREMQIIAVSFSAAEAGGDDFM